MATEIQYTSDNGGNIQKTQGSDGRLNVSSRADNRSYYNSRDEKQAYSTCFDFQSAAAGEYAGYLQNTSTIGKEFVIDSVGLNTATDARVKLWFVSGTAAGGDVLTPTNLNRSSSNAATAVAMGGGSAATGITGLTAEALIDCVYVKAGGHEEYRLADRVRLGQNDAIAIEFDEGTDGDISGVIFGYFE